MKKYIALVLFLVLVLTLYGCKDSTASSKSDNKSVSGTDNGADSSELNTDDDSDHTEQRTDIKEVSDIDVTYVSPCDVCEPFFEDDRYIYIFGNPQSDYTIVKYSDGSEQNVKDALNEGNITISDLDAFGIEYSADPKLIQSIIDHAEADGLGTDTAIEPFYKDDEYIYSFSSIRSHHVVVYFKDGTEKPVKEALEDGSVRIGDLDHFGISYYKEPIEDT